MERECTCAVSCSFESRVLKAPATTIPLTPISPIVIILAMVRFPLLIAPTIEVWVSSNFLDVVAENRIDVLVEIRLEVRLLVVITGVLV